MHEVTVTHLDCASSFVIKANVISEFDGRFSTFGMILNRTFGGYLGNSSWRCGIRAERVIGKRRGNS
jgi:hypothetical protein